MAGSGTIDDQLYTGVALVEDDGVLYGSSEDLCEKTEGGMEDREDV